MLSGQSVQRRGDLDQRAGLSHDGRWGVAGAWPVRRARRVRGAARPAVVLLWAVVLVLAALGLHAAAPWILPVRIREGPMVQMATERGAVLVWYTTRPAETAARVVIDGVAVDCAGVSSGCRHEAQIDGLSADTAYSYQVFSGTRALTDELSFQTNRSAGHAFTFIVFGDSGQGTMAQYTLATWMETSEPAADFLVHTGDMVYPDGARERYEERFFAPYRELLTRVTLWPCLGNHDVQKGAGAAPAYEEVFVVPVNGPAGRPVKHEYWFDCASARFAVLDSNVDMATLEGQVAPWLREILSGTPPQVRWKFVVFHHPPYTGGKHRPAVAVQKALVPVMDEVGVKVAFSGHDHNYQRTYPLRGGERVEEGQGIVYIVTGAGGAELYEMKPAAERPAYVAAAFSEPHSFTQVTVNGDELVGRQIGEDGRVLDEFRLRVGE